MKDERVNMRELISFSSDFLFDEKVFTFLWVVENHMDFLGRSTANIWAEHDGIFTITLEVLLIKGTR